MKKVHQDVKISYGLPSTKQQPHLLEIDGVEVGGLLSSLTFSASQSDLTKCVIEMFVNSFALTDKGHLVINDIEIKNQDIIQEICGAILSKYGWDTCLKMLLNPLEHQKCEEFIDILKEHLTALERYTSKHNIE